MTSICKQFLIAGRVQGVFYRSQAKEKAESLEVKGFVRNLSDGRVEVVACGEKAQIEALAAWLWKGPRLSKVTEVQEKTLLTADHFDDFKIRYDE